MNDLAAAEDCFSHQPKYGNAASPIIAINGDSPSPSSDSVKSSNNIVQSPGSPSHTWHAHQYSKPSSIPTPFTIKDILGLADEERFPPGQEEESRGLVVESPPLSLSPHPHCPSPQEEEEASFSMELDEPLNLTVKRERPDDEVQSPPFPTSRPLLNGSGHLFTVNHSSVSRDKSPVGALLPNDVIIPKIKLPKLSQKNGPKAKGCGAINLKTGVKRKPKDASGGPSSKVRVVANPEKEQQTVGESPDSSPIFNAFSPGLENGSSNDGSNNKKRKKARTTFTGKQIYELERQFEIKKYLSSSERSEMARLLNVTEVQVKIWFQNRRTKWKKEKGITNAEAAEHKVMATKKSKSGSGSRDNQGQGKKPPLSSEGSLSVSGSGVEDSSSEGESNSNHSFTHHHTPSPPNPTTPNQVVPSLLLSQLSAAASRDGILTIPKPHLPLSSPPLNPPTPTPAETNPGSGCGSDPDTTPFTATVTATAPTPPSDEEEEEETS